MNPDLPRNFIVIIQAHHGEGTQSLPAHPANTSGSTPHFSPRRWEQRHGSRVPGIKPASVRDQDEISTGKQATLCRFGCRRCRREDTGQLCPGPDAAGIRCPSSPCQAWGHQCLISGCFAQTFPALDSFHILFIVLLQFLLFLNCFSY